MHEGRLGAWHGSVWPVRCILASPPATAATQPARTVPGAAFPAPANGALGGEQQRVAIARSLVSKPLVLLADEPTGALDTATGHELMTLLKELFDQEGLTIVLVTHEQEVAAFARRIIRMRDGRIIGDSGAERAAGQAPPSPANAGGEPVR